MKPKSTLLRFLALAGSSLLAISSASAQNTSATWDTDADGDWTDVLNWTGDITYASGADFTATLGNFITGDRTINLNADITIGNITASDTSNNYTISGGNILTLDRTDATRPIIDVTTSTRTLTISSVIAGNDGFQKNGAGTLLLSGANTFTGDLVINAGTVGLNGFSVGGGIYGSGGSIVFAGDGTLQAPNVAAGGTINKGLTINDGVTGNLSHGSAAFGATFTGLFAGSGTLNMTASNGSSTFSNTANTFTGAINVRNSGTLTVASLGSSANAITLGSGAANGTLTYTGSAALSRGFAMGGTKGAATVNANGAGALTLSSFSAANNGAKTLTLGGTSTANNTASGNIVDSASGITSLIKSGSGKWILGSENNSYTGATGVQGGILEVSKLADGGVNSSIGAASTDFNNLGLRTGTTLRYVGSGDSTDRLFKIEGSSTIESSGSGALNFTNTGNLGYGSNNQVRTLTLSGTNADDNTLAAPLTNNGSGVVSLTKSGTGKWILSGDSSYTGATSVNGGSLLINGSTSTSAVTVAAAGTLGGIGTVGGNTTIDGTLSPGQSPGTLTFDSNLTLNNGSTYVFEAGDLTNVNGTLDLNNNWTLTLSGLGFQDGGSVTLFNYFGIAASPDLDPTITLVGLGFSPTSTLTLTDTGTSIVLNGVSAIPEPSAALLCALGMLALLRRRRA